MFTSNFDSVTTALSLRLRKQQHPSHCPQFMSECICTVRTEDSDVNENPRETSHYARPPPPLSSPSGSKNRGTQGFHIYLALAKCLSSAGVLSVANIRRALCWIHQWPPLENRAERGAMVKLSRFLEGPSVLARLTAWDNGAVYCCWVASGEILPHSH